MSINIRGTVTFLQDSSSLLRISPTNKEKCTREALVAFIVSAFLLLFSLGLCFYLLLGTTLLTLLEIKSLSPNVLDSLITLVILGILALLSAWYSVEESEKPSKNRIRLSH